MNNKELKVTFKPSGRSVYVLPKTSLLEAAGRAGFVFETPCGGKGTCGKCRVKVVAGNCSLGISADSLLSEDDISSGVRLACKTLVTEDISVEILSESLLSNEHKILVNDSGVTGDFQPVVKKRYFELNAPTSEDCCSDIERLTSVVGDVDIPSEQLKKLPMFLRANNWRGTAVVAGNKLIAFEVGDTSGRAFGVAFDIGTTTIVGTLFDLTTGVEVGVASLMNPQVGFGDDVISRIARVRENSSDLLDLQESVLGAVNEIISKLIETAHIASDNIYEIVVAGNSTMQQILCGIDPSALGEIPFAAAFSDALQMPLSSLGIRGNPRGEVYIFPQVGGFVGGDTVAGMVAARIDKCEGSVLLVDIGTNGEIVLAHNGRIVATSTAAGPAFEGARIKQGMRATAGAIEKIVINDDVQVNIIGNSEPVGLCGTALIDAVAELLRIGVIDNTGRILPKEELPAGVSPFIVKRLVTNDNQTDFILVHKDDTSSKEPICLWQKDVRELQLAMGAIRAGINILLKRMNINESDLTTVLLAGAFGNFIRRSNARRIGLLPQISCAQIRFIGNAASLGAKLALLSDDERVYAGTLQKRTEHIDLSLDAEFQNEFGMAMLFPDGEMDTCGE